MIYQMFYVSGVQFAIAIYIFHFTRIKSLARRFELTTLVGRLQRKLSINQDSI